MILLAGEPSTSTDYGSGVYYRCALEPSEPARWAWASDTHISGNADAGGWGHQPSRQLERAVAEIAEYRPCGVLVNGDLAWALGQREDYERFLGIMRPLTKQAALVLAPGNHDERSNLLACLGGREGPPPRWLAAVVEQPPFRLVALDSSIAPHTVGGKIGGDQLAWLEEVLASRPLALTIIFVHHPGESSSEGCSDFCDLVRLAQRQRCVQAIVTAHDHRYSLTRLGEVHHICLPAVGFAFENETPTGWVAAVLGQTHMDLRFREPGGLTAAHLTWR